jgi:uncharacterized protein (TIGR02300 family)
VAKPEWGMKRTCHHCGARFYDLRRSPIICPKCEAVFNPESAVKTRRAKVVEAPVLVPEPEAWTPDEPEVGIPADEAEVVGDEKEEEGEAIEDASELGEDKEDVSEVVDNVEDPER